MATGSAAALDDETIGSLFSRLIEDGKDFVRAEANVYKRTATLRLAQSRTAIVFIVVGAMLSQAALVALLVGSVLALARFLGPLGAGLVVALVALAVAGLFVWLAVKRLSAVAAEGISG